MLPPTSNATPVKLLPGRLVPLVSFQSTWPTTYTFQLSLADRFVKLSSASSCGSPEASPVPICRAGAVSPAAALAGPEPSNAASCSWTTTGFPEVRSEEHTSELQSLTNLVCRLLLEKKNKKK